MEGKQEVAEVIATDATSENQDFAVSNETSDRPLAYSQTVKELRPIEGADRIEVATILGWPVVVKKGLYQVGDLLVYCEIDSILPDWQYFKEGSIFGPNIIFR
jgi:hypothetical protein